MTSRRLAAPSLIAVSALALAGCASAAGDSGGGDGVRIVTSTSVYGSIAKQLVGDAAEVTAIIDSATQDPHSYEATARDQLAVKEADIVVMNGGGYDPFMEQLLEGSDAEVVTAVEFSHDWPENEGHDAAGGDAHEHGAEEPAEGDSGHDHGSEEPADEHDGHDHGDHGHVEGFNEHVWYDPHTMVHVAEAMAESFSAALPDDEADIAAAAESFGTEVGEIEAQLEQLAAAHGGAGAFVTEPVSGYLAEAAGLTDVTPEGFAESVEEGQDVSPATLLAAVQVIDSGQAAVVLANAQTGGAETERIESEAEKKGVPVVRYTELPPKGEDYAEWMSGNVTTLADALGG